MNYKDVPQEVRKELEKVIMKEPFKMTGVVSNITGHTYIYEHGSDSKLGYFPNQHERLSEIYDKLFVHVQNIIDNFVGIPVKLKDLPLSTNYRNNDYPHFSTDTFEISSSESPGGSISPIIKHFNIGKLHLKSIEGKKIISLCSHCNSFKCEESEKSESDFSKKPEKDTVSSQESTVDWTSPFSFE